MARKGWGGGWLHEPPQDEAALRWWQTPARKRELSVGSATVVLAGGCLLPGVRVWGEGDSPRSDVMVRAVLPGGPWHCRPEHRLCWAVLQVGRVFYSAILRCPVDGWELLSVAADIETSEARARQTCERLAREEREDAARWAARGGL